MTIQEIIPEANPNQLKLLKRMLEGLIGEDKDFHDGEEYCVECGIVLPEITEFVL